MLRLEITEFSASFIKLPDLSLPHLNNLNDQNVIDDLEHIDDELEEKGIELVKCSDKGVEKEYGFNHLPMLIYFQNELPTAYDGDLDEENEILKWIFDTMAKSEIEEVTGPILDVLIERLDNLAVIFFDNQGTKILLS